MIFDDDDPDRGGVLRAIRDAVVAGDDVLAERLASGLESEESLERAVVAALDRVGYEKGTYRRFTGGLIRWLRRAAGDDQMWALVRIGLKRPRELSLDELDLSLRRGPANPEDVTPEAEIDQAEAHRCLEIAAGRGHRRAAFELGTLESLLTAYGDGDSDELLDDKDLRSIQARIAVQLSDLGDPEAAVWFRRAVASPRWEDSDGWFTWLSAMLFYGDWAHKRGDLNLCDQISSRIVDDAVLWGEVDRGLMDAYDYKTYRDSYQLAVSNESVRWHAMEHLLTEHDLSPDAGVELLRLLSRNHHFLRSEHRDLAFAVWDRRHGPIPDPAAVESLAWELIGWLLREVIPAVLRTVGCGEHAARIEKDLAAIDLSVDGFWEPTFDDRRDELVDRHYWDSGEPLDELETEELETLLFESRSGHHPLIEIIKALVDPERAMGWRAVRDAARAAEATADPWFRETFTARSTLERVGLGSSVSCFEYGLRTRPSAEYGDRLLGGSDVWIVMWLATTTSAPEGWIRSSRWHEVWDRISPMVSEYIATAATSARYWRSGDSADRGLVDAHHALEAFVADGVHRRIDQILRVATTDSAQ